MWTDFLKTVGTFIHATLDTGHERVPPYIIVPLPAAVGLRNASTDTPVLADDPGFRQGVTVIFDGSECQHIDSYGIGVLVQQHTAAMRCNAKFVLVLPEGRVRRTLQVTRVNTLFPIFDSVAEAVASVTDVESAQGNPSLAHRPT